MVIPGAYASNGSRIFLASSDPNTVEIVGNNQIIPHRTGSVTLTFQVPEDDQYVAAHPRTRTLEVVKPTKSAWLENRKKDPRYNRVKDRFISRRLSTRSAWTSEQLAYEFDSDSFDSDGDGYSNLFERATGMDSLGYDPQNAPSLIPSAAGKPRISFVRYSNPLSSTGEQFEYIIEESLDLRSWTPASVVLENKINIGGGMERHTYQTSQSFEPGAQKFIRLNIRKQN